MRYNQLARGTNNNSMVVKVDYDEMLMITFDMACYFLLLDEEHDFLVDFPKERAPGYSWRGSCWICSRVMRRMIVGYL